MKPIQWGHVNSKSVVELLLFESNLSVRHGWGVYSQVASAIGLLSVV